MESGASPLLSNMSNDIAELIPWHLIVEFTHTFALTTLALLKNRPWSLVTLIILPGRLDGTNVPLGKCSMLLKINGEGIVWVRMKFWRWSRLSSRAERLSSSGIRKVASEPGRKLGDFSRILRRMTNPWYDFALISAMAALNSVWFSLFVDWDSATTKKSGTRIKDQRVAI
ncbi:hypothetical protein Ddye_015901 [Dipteronia dyeriana]|uniref:Uncharacterized protein n=1 Tax=Dipteronia dyeriana TaxID=168575 RepID=A0AAD9U5V4_9ROSI|nr:hypothetical protein Ddye_015901 [Dipteronia dyeriana]